MSKSQKFRNIAVNPTVAFVVDDIASHDPWRVRCLEIRGTAEQAHSDDDTTGDNDDVLQNDIIRITPKRIISFASTTPTPTRISSLPTPVTSETRHRLHRGARIPLSQARSRPLPSLGRRVERYGNELVHARITQLVEVL